MRRAFGDLLSGLFVLGAVSIGSAARADTGETNRMTAETLFVEAKKLMEAGNFAQACPKFADSQKLDPGVGTLLNLARCYERQGKVASAWSTYREAASAARGAGQAERENHARQQAAALEPRLSRLTVTVPTQLSSAEGVELRLDGALVPSSLWGVAAPVDPGEHSVEATAKGRKPWSAHVTVVPPSNQSIVVPDLEVAPADAKSSSSTGADETPPRKEVQRPIALVLGGVGVVGIVVGSVFGLSAKSTYHQGDPECNGNVCTSQGRELRDSAYGKATVSTVAFAVGGAALVSGVIVWLTAPPRRNASTVGVSVTPPISDVPGTISLRGAW